MNQRNFDIPSLDGIRAVSIGVVFVSHAGAESVIPGGLGVTVFFVLSGFLITTLLRLEFERTDTIAIGEFYLRRVFRILPLFYAVLLLATLLTLVAQFGTGTVDAPAWFAQVGHITNYWAIFEPGHRFMEGTGVYWSLAVEEHFYLVFPVVFWLMNRGGMSRRAQGWSLLVACAVVLLWRFVLVFGLDATVDRTYLATDTRIDSLLIGCAVAIFLNPVLDRHAASPVLARRAIAAAAVLVLTLAFRNDSFRETLRYTVQSGAIAVLMIYVVAVPTSVAGRVLNLRPIVWCGRLSYAFYLVHFVILIEVRQHLATIPAALVSLVLAILVAVALQRVVERPAHRLRNRVLNRPMRPAVASAV